MFNLYMTEADYIDCFQCHSDRKYEVISYRNFIILSLYLYMDLFSQVLNYSQLRKESWNLNMKKTWALLQRWNKCE